MTISSETNAYILHHMVWLVALLETELWQPYNIIDKLFVQFVNMLQIITILQPYNTIYFKWGIGTYSAFIIKCSINECFTSNSQQSG